MPKTVRKSENDPRIPAPGLRCRWLADRLRRKLIRPRANELSSGLEREGHSSSMDQSFDTARAASRICGRLSLINRV